MQNPNGPKIGDSQGPSNPTPVAAEVKLRQWFPELSPASVARLAVYHAEVLKANNDLSLLPSNGIKNLAAMYFADGIVASRLIRREMITGQALYDAGGAGGFPGFVFAILFSDQRVVLLERDENKLGFFKRVALQMKLSNLTVLEKGIDELPEQSISNLVVRGSVPMARTLLAYRKAVAKGGKLFHMKSDSWTAELSALPSQLFSVWSPSLLGQYRVPETNSDMVVVSTEKIAS